MSIAVGNRLAALADALPVLDGPTWAGNQVPVSLAAVSGPTQSFLQFHRFGSPEALHWAIT